MAVEAVAAQPKTPAGPIKTRSEAMAVIARAKAAAAEMEREAALNKAA